MLKRVRKIWTFNSLSSPMFLIEFGSSRWRSKKRKILNYKAYNLFLAEQFTIFFSAEVCKFLFCTFENKCCGFAFFKLFTSLRQFFSPSLWTIFFDSFLQLVFFSFFVKIKPLKNVIMIRKASTIEIILKFSFFELKSCIKRLCHLVLHLKNALSIGNSRGTFSDDSNNISQILKLVQYDSTIYFFSNSFRLCKICDFELW